MNDTILRAGIASMMALTLVASILIIGSGLAKAIAHFLRKSRAGRTRGKGKSKGFR